MVVIYIISGIKAILQDSSVKIADDEALARVHLQSLITRVSCKYDLAHVLCTIFYLRPTRIKKKGKSY
jgi:hypothetical protein